MNKEEIKFDPNKGILICILLLIVGLMVFYIGLNMNFFQRYNNFVTSDWECVEWGNGYWDFAYASGSISDCRFKSLEDIPKECITYNTIENSGWVTIDPVCAGCNISGVRAELKRTNKRGKCIKMVRKK